MSRNKEKVTDNRPILNAYPDSMGTTLSDIVSILKREEFREVFQSLYLLPSLFNSDMDRGFSVIDYGINELLAKPEDLEELEGLGIRLKLDIILNHASVLSKQFQDILKNGEQSIYKDFFINWNKFWEGCGEMTEEGYILPREDLIQGMYFRKPGLPILMVRMPDGKDVPYWNTFYQEVRYKQVDAFDLVQKLEIQYGSAVRLAELINASLDQGKKASEIDLGEYSQYTAEVTELLESSRKYLGQMDLNIKSPLVWEFYDNTLKTLAGYGARIIRLDAFAYACKEPGERNFFNEPGIWELLLKLKSLADRYDLMLLPEIHASYSDKIHIAMAEKGFMVYDFFLPGLILDAMERGNGTLLVKWADELQSNHIHVINMLGCHDGIPILDLRGMIGEEQITELVQIVVGRGGYVKNLHGQKNLYYQVNATYYSALGEDDNKMLLARAIQLFMPGKPQVWYLDLFAGKNDYEAVEKGGKDSHKEINRSNMTLEQINTRLEHEVVKQQLAMIRFRNNSKAFGWNAVFISEAWDRGLKLCWENEGQTACLVVDFAAYTFVMTGLDEGGEEIFHLETIAQKRSESHD